MRLVQANAGSSRGAVLVEAAIALPVLCAFIFLIIDWAWFSSELMKVRWAIDKTEREFVTASSVKLMTPENALAIVGDTYRTQLTKIGVPFERVLLNPEVLVQPAANREYVLFTASELFEEPTEIPLVLPRIYQVNFQYRPNCFFCTALGEGLRMVKRKNEFVVNLSVLVVLEHQRSLLYSEYDIPQWSQPCPGQNEVAAYVYKTTPPAGQVECLGGVS